MTDLSELIERIEHRVGNPSAWPEVAVWVAALQTQGE
jgi:hypothetical protein